MIIKTIVDEDFINYKQPSMYIGTAYCNGKCCREAGIPMSVCQNDEWRKTATVEMASDDIIERYLSITPIIFWILLTVLRDVRPYLCIAQQLSL